MGVEIPSRTECVDSGGFQVKVKNPLAVLACTFAAGCWLQPADGLTAVDGGLGPNSDDMRVELDRHRSEFLPKQADEHFAAGARLYWLQSGTLIPTLRSVNVVTGEQIAYGFSIGVDGSNFAYKASEQMVATVTQRGQVLTYSAYAAGERKALLGEFDVPAPTDEQRWWPFCVDGNTMYFADNVGGGHVYRWAPNQATPQEVLQLAPAGINLGVLLELGVENGQLLVLESGRLWSINLATRQARWLKNRQEADQISFDSSGILFRTPEGLFFEDATSPGSLRNVSAEIMQIQSPVVDSEWAHRDDEQQAALNNGQVIYVGWSGVFVYGLSNHTVKPVLLEPSFAVTGQRIDYRNPQLTSDGSLFVTGLQSESGALGAEGPVYRVSNWR